MVVDERHSMQCEPSVAAPVAGPAAIRDLERRVDEAAIMTIGAAAFDAAEQARRAAELAERASVFAATLAGNPLPPHEPPPSPQPVDAVLLPPEPDAGEIRVSAARPPVAAARTQVAAGQVPLAAPETTTADFEDERLCAFHLRADRLADRLRAIGSRPVSLTA